MVDLIFPSMRTKCDLVNQTEFVMIALDSHPGRFPDSQSLLSCLSSVKAYDEILFLMLFLYNHHNLLEPFDVNRKDIFSRLENDTYI